MKKIFLSLFIALATNTFAQMRPVTTYDRGDLFFVHANLSSEGNVFLYSYKWDYEPSKSWFTIFNDNVDVVKYVEIEPQMLSETTENTPTNKIGICYNYLG